jgi:hypothetical protein
MMSSSWQKWFSGLLCCLVLSACSQSGPPSQDLPQITFKHLPTVNLNVSQIDVVDNSQASSVGKNVEYKFPTAPKKALKSWANDRLNANGTSGLAVFTINDASAIEEKLDKKTGISGIFTNDQSERYTTNVDVTLELFDAMSKRVGTASAKASRFTTMAENATLLEREKAWFELVEKMMVDFDKELTSNMNLNLLGR